MSFTVTESTWIIADTHFGHDNIVRYCNRPINHNGLMSSKWKRLVKKNDPILHLGDLFVWYGLKHGYWRKKMLTLPGDKYLIKGNHDDDQEWTDAQWLKYTGFKVISEFRQKEVYFSHEPSVDEGLWYVNIHGHTHTHSPFGFYSRSGTNFFNASIEGMNYRPWRLGDILKKC